MKRLRPMFKKLEFIFLKEIPPSELMALKYMTEFEVIYYEAFLIERRLPVSIREILDCVDFVVLHERDLRCFEYWSRMGELYRRAMQYLRENTSIDEDPIFGEGNYAEDRIRPRYKYKLRLLRSYATSKGYVIG